MSLKSTLMMSCGVGLALAVSGQAFAQSSAAAGGRPGTGASSDTGALTEVVVTAQKREENLQSAPVAVTAIAPAELTRAGVEDFSNLQKVAPDLTVNNVVGATNIAIRGVRELALGPTNDTPTAVHIDGLYLSRPTGLQGTFYDVQRLEVLKGPQGTLYGRNATGGVVNIITNKPSTDAFAANVEAEAGNYGLYRLEGALNGPVSDAVALRGAFRVYHHDGYFSNGLDDADQKGGRLELLFKPTPKARLLLSGDIEESDRNGQGTALVGTAVTSKGAPAPIVPVSSDPFNASSILYPLGLGPTKEYEKIYGSMAQFDYDFDFATLTAQVGNRRNVLAINTVTLGSTVAVPATLGYSHTTESANTTSAEVRLASNATKPLQWVGGAYYFTEHSNGDMCAPGSFVWTACGIDIGNPYSRTISYAAFGQATYTPPIMDDALHLTLGARYNSDVKKANVYTKLGGFFLANSSGLKADFDRTTYKVGVSYDVTSRNLIYGNISSGFRAGGFAYGLTPLYQPESILAYELGSKNRFFENKLQLNLDAFHYNYKNVETNVIVPAPAGSGLPFSDLSVQSIGKVHYTGASVQLIYALTPSDRIEADVEYLNAHYGSYRIPTRYIASPPLGLNGLPNGEPAGVFDNLQVANTPPWTGTAAYDHTWAAFSGRVDGRVATQWSADRHFANNFTDTLQYQASTAKGYARFDLSLHYTPDIGRWNLTAYVNNVGNAHTYSSLTYENATGSGLVTGTLFPPRTAGVIFGAKF